MLIQQIPSRVVARATQAGDATAFTARPERLAQGEVTLAGLEDDVQKSGYPDVG